MLMHEMDAIRCKEWKIFPGMSLLPDDAGFVVFMLAHIPLYCWLIAGLVGGVNPERLMRGLGLFFIIHLGLHAFFLMHRKNEFKDALSWTIISGAAVAGLIDYLWPML